LVHIAGWTEFADGERRFPRPLYGLGDLPDVPRPVADHNARSLDSYHRRRARKAQRLARRLPQMRIGRVSSIFELGQLAAHTAPGQPLFDKSCRP